MSLKKKAREVVKQGVKVTLTGIGALLGEELAETLFKEKPEPEKKKKDEEAK